jgi:hypothetical protein
LPQVTVGQAGDHCGGSVCSSGMARLLGGLRLQGRNGARCHRFERQGCANQRARGRHRHSTPRRPTEVRSFASCSAVAGTIVLPEECCRCAPWQESTTHCPDRHESSVREFADLGQGRGRIPFGSRDQRRSSPTIGLPSLRDSAPIRRGAVACAPGRTPAAGTHCAKVILAHTLPGLLARMGAYHRPLPR